MAGLNKVLLIGNVGGDPEIRTLPSGSKVANFSLATSETYNDRNGQRQTQTEWHRIEIWDGLANVVEQYVKKGDPLFIEGKIRNEKWTDQNGQERTGVRIRALAMQMLGRAGGDNSSSGGNDYPSSEGTYGNQSPAGSSSRVNEPDPQFTTGTDEDDLPF
ncbi:single-stranded DNA-binding protein [Jiulongibacter sediminis]|uniref:Single-stranded DNA-binding protein n=1 Tax=Jiulongibacter sediminis TaxID=1605367 RepID=A0A0P7BBY0_9BACT|nr:single-stranded DNA-binding protein [Jiulongibacter sediminis]KPM48027.1 single-stranded DNA-binding protein [Jiulongibacter sediminis]TBX24207.1 single-stranded DNA-binding protein [Jiulongibacter sediminis]